MPRGLLRDRGREAIAVDSKIYVVGGAKIPSGVELPDGLNPGGPIEILGTTEIATYRQGE
jgi:hypothetical protein